MFCSNCGKEIESTNATCNKCGHSSRNNIKIEIINKYNQRKSYAVALILCFLFGFFSAHRFYLGRTGSAIIQLLMIWILSFPTLGISALIGMLWVIIDFILILVGSLTDKDGNELV